MKRMYWLLLLAFAALPSWQGRAYGYNSTFVDLSDGNFDDLNVITNFVNNMTGLGMTNLIITATGMKDPGSGCTANTMRAVAKYQTYDYVFARVEKFAKEAKRRGMSLIVGGGMTMMACLADFHTDTVNREHAAIANQYLAGRVEALRLQYPATIVGFYIPDEVFIAGPEYHSFVKRQVDAIRTVTQMNIYLSPFLGGVALSPTYVAQLAANFLAATQVTALLYQDSAGAFGQLLKYGTGSPNVDQYFERLGAYNGWRVSPLIETFNYVFPVGSGTGVGSPSIARTNYQLWEARHALQHGAIRTTWIAQNHLNLRSGMASWAFDYHSQGERHYYETRALLGRGGATFIPFTYKFLSNPPYYWSYGTLNDAQPGNPTDVYDGNWLFFAPGGVALEVDFGTERNIDFAALHTAGYPLWGLQIPPSLTLRCSTNGANWSERTFATETAALGLSGEYTVSNSEALGLKCRYMQVYAFSPYYTFASELTFTSRQ